jgi:hypothetical protein
MAAGRAEPLHSERTSYSQVFGIVTTIATPPTEVVMTFNPTTPQGFPGTIGRTIAESTPHFPSHEGDGTKPNILIVLLDDVGFADFGCYGS